MYPKKDQRRRSFLPFRRSLPVHGSQGGISQRRATQGAFEEGRKILLLTKVFADDSQHFIRKDFDIRHNLGYEICTRRRQRGARFSIPNPLVVSGITAMMQTVSFWKRPMLLMPDVDEVDVMVATKMPFDALRVFLVIIATYFQQQKTTKASICF